MDRERLADEDEAISPDVVSRREQPVDPAEAVRREREKYGENSSNPNRDDGTNTTANQKTSSSCR
jgi:hypothetical protein